MKPIYALVLVLAACGGGGSGGGGPAANTPPTATAGDARYVAAGAAVTLTGVGADADGDALAYSWALNGSDFPGQSLTFTTAPTAATYTATITVSDGKASTLSTSRVYATPPGAALVELGVGSETLAAMPFSAARNINAIRVSTPWVTVARFRLVTQGAGPFTVSSLGTQAPWNGIEARFVGLVDGQAVPAGTPVEFTLEATPTFVYREIDHRWTFTIAETGQAFVLEVTLATTQ